MTVSGSQCILWLGAGTTSCDGSLTPVYRPPVKDDVNQFLNQFTLPVWTPMSLNREQTFACIAFFDSGELNIDPMKLKGVLAMCHQNSIYVAGVLLSDPSDRTPENDIRHIVGNIGRRGFSMLVAPQNPMIRPPSKDYKVINHHYYDCNREDNFKGTTLHLSFTEWKNPSDRHERRTHD